MQARLDAALVASCLTLAATAALPAVTGLTGSASAVPERVGTRSLATGVGGTAQGPAGLGSATGSGGRMSFFRSVSRAEADDIVSFGGFRAGPTSYEGKLFATTMEDATRYGRINHQLPGGEPFWLVELDVPTGLAGRLERVPNVDRMQAVHVPEDLLDAVNAQGRWQVFDFTPWVEGVQWRG